MVYFGLKQIFKIVIVLLSVSTVAVGFGSFANHLAKRTWFQGLISKQPKGFGQDHQPYKLKNEIVMMGDSLTARWNAWKTDFTNQDVQVLADSEIEPLKFFNILKQNGQKTTNKATPQKIFFLMGINSIRLKNYDSEKLFQQYINLFAFMFKQWPNVKIYVQSVLPINETKKMNYKKWFFNENTQQDIVKMNEKLRWLTTASPNLIYLELHHLLLKNGVLDPIYTYDGLHLTQKAKPVWSLILKRNINN